MRVTPRVAQLAPNAILAIVADCRRRRAMGQRIVDLSLGEPDFATPTHIVEAAVRAVADGHTRYTPPEGIAPLRLALRSRLAAAGLVYRPREVMATCGATGALTCAFQALLAAGDEVLVPLPCYPAYGTQIALVGAVPVPVATDAAAGFKVRPEDVRAAVTPRSRVLILNNPSNPTGAVYTREELEALLEAVVAAGLFVVCDEVYCDLRHDRAPFVSFAAVGTARARSLIVRSVSKTYAMTGWRIGFAAGPEPIIAAMAAVQEAGVVMPASVSQWAALAALTGPQGGAETMARSFADRYRYVRDRLATMSGVHVAEGRAGFFAFADVGEIAVDAGGLCRWLLDRHGVAVVPGEAFGVARGMRLSCAAAPAEIEEGLARFESGLVELRSAHGHAA